MSQKILSPMPGKINKVSIKAGEKVLTDQELFIIESMKMEMPIVAPKEGKIDRILVDEGQAVEKDMVLAEII